MKASIHFFNEDISYNLKHKKQLKRWIKETIESEGKELRELNFIFCSDEYLLDINERFLKHSTYTDIITFDNSDSVELILGDIFISMERVKENALKYQVSPEDELHRIMIHGTLHLLGYKDKPKINKVLMTNMENKYLALRGL